ncbi:hypothetical protein PULV_a2646 [Pseudoalteromonas ulvae UL12]|uniref:Tetratricopeptide repeat protein n=1 Tax=Pseudoalteromonas ulvae TaxID=107327 RepID=A0A244CNZ6_PSEDV|nr:hypothetical protein [Pseudoalteromonas ulvae]MBE0364334.1 hypothetical protein [Pseudoalteromonas ulvae UL12]OUL57351.1 hypothetical protein B1199_14395 [Pseudoalteromonas ulvae]
MSIAFKAAIVCCFLALSLHANSAVSSLLAPTAALTALVEQGELGDLNASQRQTIFDIDRALNHENFSLAHTLSKQFLQQAPNLAAAHFMYAKTCLEEAKESYLSAFSLSNKAQTHFTRAQELAPNNGFFMLHLTGYYHLTPWLFGGGDDDGDYWLEQLSQRSPRYHLLAKSTFHSNSDELAELVEQAKTQFPDDLLLHLNIGLVLIKKQEEDLAEQALLYSYQLIESQQYPHSLVQMTRYYMGFFALQNQTQLNNGIVALNAFIDAHNKDNNDPYFLWAHYNLASLYLEHDKEVEAKDIFGWLALNSVDAKLTKLTQKKLNMLK